MRTRSDKAVLIAIVGITLLCLGLLLSVITPGHIPVKWHWYLQEGFTEVNLQRLSFPYPMGGPLLPVWIEYWDAEHYVPLRIVIWQNVLYTVLYTGLLLGLLTSQIREWKFRIPAIAIALSNPLYWSAAVSEVTSAFVSLLFTLAWILRSWFLGVSNIRLIHKMLYGYCSGLLLLGCYYSRAEVAGLAAVMLAEPLIQRAPQSFRQRLSRAFCAASSYLLALRGFAFCFALFMVLDLCRQYAPPYLGSLDVSGQLLYFVYAGISFFSIAFMSPFFLGSFWGIGGVILLGIGAYRAIKVQHLSGLWVVAAVVLYAGYVSSGHLGMAPFEIWRYLTILYVPQVILIISGISEVEAWGSGRSRKIAVSAGLLFVLCLSPYYSPTYYRVTQYVSFAMGAILIAALVVVLTGKSIGLQNVTRRAVIAAVRQYCWLAIGVHFAILCWVVLCFIFPPIPAIIMNHRLGSLLATELTRLLGSVFFLRGGFYEHLIVLLLGLVLLWMVQRYTLADKNTVSNSDGAGRLLLFTFIMTSIIVHSIRPNSWISGWVYYSDIIMKKYKYQEMDMQRERRILFEWQENNSEKVLFVPVVSSQASSEALLMFKVEGGVITSSREILVPYHDLLLELCDNPPCYIYIGLARYVTPSIHNNILRSPFMERTQCYAGKSINYSPQHYVYGPDINLCVYRWAPDEMVPLPKE